MALNESIVYNIERILDYYNIDYITYPNRVAFACPIHKSDRPESLTVFTSPGHTTGVGNFVCWTNHCENDHGKGVINLVRTLQSDKIGRECSLMEAVKQVEQITGVTCPMEAAINRDIRNFNSFVKKLNIDIETKVIATRDYVKKNLTTPAKYYIDRGYKPQTLDFYDVGLCVRKGQQMFMRVTVPVYDVTGEFLIGCVGRSLNPECPMCNRYHAPNRACPTNPMEEKWARKWINSTGFNTGDTLYNLWNAAEPAREKQKLILVEGQGDIWRLHEAGIDNAVGLFGNKITDNQFLIIESLGITDIYIALDTDPEGLKGRQRVIERLKYYYNLHEVDITQKDIGDCSVEEIHKFLTESGFY